MLGCHLQGECSAEAPVYLCVAVSHLALAGLLLQVGFHTRLLRYALLSGAAIAAFRRHAGDGRADDDTSFCFSFWGGGSRNQRVMVNVFCLGHVCARGA